MLLGVGLHYLRSLFRSFHPHWGNQPSDASALMKGALKLRKHEQPQFYDGNIDKSDVSLLISVLRFSKVSSGKLAADPDKRDAVGKIHEIRNKIFAHASDKRVNKVDFQRYWGDLKHSLMKLGATEDEIHETLTGIYKNTTYYLPNIN